MEIFSHPLPLTNRGRGKSEDGKGTFELEKRIFDGIYCFTRQTFPQKRAVEMLCRDVTVNRGRQTFQPMHIKNIEVSSVVLFPSNSSCEIHRTNLCSLVLSVAFFVNGNSLRKQTTLNCSAFLYICTG